MAKVRKNEQAELKLVGAAPKTGTSNAKRRRYKRLAFSLLCLLAVIIGGIAMVWQYTRISRQRAEIERLEKEIAGVQSVNDELQRQLNYMKTDDYIKSFARDQLGLLLPGEIRFIDDSK